MDEIIRGIVIIGGKWTHIVAMSFIVKLIDGCKYCKYYIEKTSK